MKRKIEDLEEFKALSDIDKAILIKEYQKGYHFLLFYGKFFVIILMVLSLEYRTGPTKNLPWVHRYLIYGAMGYLFSIIINLIEINIVAKKVIQDLVKGIRKR